jgi:hypothetical protein
MLDVLVTGMKEWGNWGKRDKKESGKRKKLNIFFFFEL